MIEVNKFVGCMQEAGVDLFTGVPDSLLKSFCAYVTDTCGENHVIAANEGGAVGFRRRGYPNGIILDGGKEQGDCMRENALSY